MRVDLDAKVRSRDGKDIGSVQAAILDPGTNEVTYLVISTGALFGRDVLLPRVEIDRVTPEGDALRIELSKAEVEKLDEYVPEHYTVPPAGWVAPMPVGLAYPGYLWPVADRYPPTTAPVEPVEEVEAPEQVRINKGAVVFGRDGDDLGVVDDVRFDPESGRLLGVVVRVGGALQTLFGGGETLELPSTQIDHVEANAVFLQVDKDTLTRKPDPQEA